MAEKRRFTRLASCFIVRIRGRRPTSFESFDFESTITNISKGGVFIETPTPFERGTIVDLEFTIPRHADRVQAHGVVRWSGRTAEGTMGMGIEFDRVTITSREAIGSYVDERVRAEDLAALVVTPLRAALLRTHASRIGQSMSLEILARMHSATAEEIREAVAAFERVGLLRVSGGEVTFQNCPSGDLQDAIRRWLA